ncbi:MAG: exodeoxyribonuclease III [Alphaproteobacteria bacterium]
MKIASWNVNSLRIRGPILARYLATAKPDVLCLQETKVEDKDFPHDLVRELGFEHALYTGEKSYNGVAILSRQPLQPLPSMDVSGSGAKRHLAATLPNGFVVHNFYVPAGGDIADPETNPKFADKLAFMDGLTRWSQSLDPKTPTILLGDLNIAPYEHDVWSSRQLRDVVSHTPVEREKMLALRDTIGWIDVARHFVPMEEKLYSWWSYRNRDWKASNRGRRLDHLWVTPGLKSALKDFTITQETRDWETTSDHVPVMVTLAA